MSDVKRCEPFGRDGLSSVMHEDSVGDYVRYDDHEAKRKGWIEQHARDSKELRELCQARDEARKERDQLRAELDAIRGQPSAALIEATRELISAAQSVNRSKAHEVRGLADEQPCYWQRKEWIDWFVENGEKARKALDALPPQQPDAVSVPRELEALQAECDNLRISLKDADHGMVLFMQQRDELLQELEAIKRPGQVRVPEYLLQRALRADASKGAGPAQLLDGWAAMEELRSLLSTRQAEEGE